MGNEVIDYKAKVIELTEKEFESFKENLLKQSTEEVFYHNYEIHVKTELMEVIINECLDDYLYPILYSFGNGLLDYLYNDFIYTEYASVNTLDDTEQFIEESIKYWMETKGE